MRFFAPIVETNKITNDMKKLFTILSAASMFTMLWQGCEANVDLNNIDTSVEVKANVATPIGSVKATIGDFVGDGTWGIFIDSVKNHGVLTFKDTFSIARNFHNLDLSQYISNTTLKMNVYDQVEGQPYFVNGKITGNDQPIVLTFPLTLKLNGINNNLNHQRIDSALINDAKFVSNITSIGGLPLEWDWIEKVELKLGENFHRSAGNIVTVYKKGDGYGYNQNIGVSIDEFSMNLMKNKNPESWQDYSNNVVDTCNFEIMMHIVVPSSAGEILIPSTAAFQYKLDVQFIDYEAVWGMFEPSKDMSSEAEDVIATYWSPWNDILKLRLPFAEPSVNMLATTQIAGAMIMEGDYLYTQNAQGETAYATFDEKETKHSLYKYFTKNEYLPLNSPIGAEATMHVLFDKDPERGHIDKLFAIRPDKIGYKFSVKFNQQETPQIRITKNTSIKLDAVCNLPMIFNQGVELAYADTIKGIDLSMLDLDSLLSDVDMVDTLEKASAKLVIKIENSIPLQFKGVLTCLDENNNVIINPKTNEPFLITENDTIVIGAPQYEFNNHTWQGTALESVEVVNVDREDLETIQRIKSIAYHVSLDDESLAYAYEQGLFNVKLTADNHLRIKLAVGANVEGVLKLEF
jgi:hypothetical protein